MVKQIELSGPEAGLLLAMSVSLADDDPSENEIIVLRKYYLKETAAVVEKKFMEAGMSWSAYLQTLEGAITARLGKVTPAFRKRSLAIALELAMADGKVDQNEMHALGVFCASLGLSMADVDSYRKKVLREIDSVTGYGEIQDLDSASLPLEMELAPGEAAIALVMMVAASDDNPSDAELALIRTYCAAADAEALAAKVKAAGGTWPSDLGRCKNAVLACMRGLSRESRFKYLVLAYKTAMADGAVRDDEKALIQGFCNDLVIGYGELEACAPCLESLMRSA